MIRLYICQNKDGSLYIDKNAKDGEIAAYLQEVAGWESVRELVANVNTRYQEACVKDEALKNLKDMLDGKTSVHHLKNHLKKIRQNLSVRLFMMQNHRQMRHKTRNERKHGEYTKRKESLAGN